MQVRDIRGLAALAKPSGGAHAEEHHFTTHPHLYGEGPSLSRIPEAWASKSSQQHNISPKQHNQGREGVTAASAGGQWGAARSQGGSAGGAVGPTAASGGTAVGAAPGTSGGGGPPAVRGPGGRPQPSPLVLHPEISPVLEEPEGLGEIGARSSAERGSVTSDRRSSATAVRFGARAFGPRDHQESIPRSVSDAPEGVSERPSNGSGAWSNESVASAEAGEQLPAAPAPTSAATQAEEAGQGRGVPPVVEVAEERGSGRKVRVWKGFGVNREDIESVYLSICLSTCLSICPSVHFV